VWQEWKELWGGGGIISKREAREDGRGQPLPSSPFFSPSALVARTFSFFPPLSAPAVQAAHLAEPSTKIAGTPLKSL